MNNGRVSNSFVGFNPEKARVMLSIIDDSFESLTGVTADVIFNIQNLSKGIDSTGQYINEGWYSDEAAKFFNTVFAPAAGDMLKRLSNEFSDIKTLVVDAIRKWAVATGDSINVSSYLPGVGAMALSEYPNNKNGKKGVDLKLYDTLKKSSQQKRNNLEEKFNNSIRHIVEAGAFLGSAQMSNINASLNNLKKVIINEYDKIINIALKEIKETSNKYNQTATQVSSSFNN